MSEGADGARPRHGALVRDGVLEVRKKPSWCPDPELVELYEDRAKGLIAGSVIPSNPFTFHTRFYWTDQIPYRVVNPEVNANWASPEMAHTTQLQVSLRAKLGRLGLSTARALLSQTQRNSKIQMVDLLQCPACKSTELKYSDSVVDCIGCGKQYEVVAGVPRMSVEP